MWEAIQRNQRRSWILIGIMGLILLALGYAVGGALLLRFSDHSQEPVNLLTAPGPWIGVLVAAGLWIGLACTALFGGDAILLRSATAHEIQKEDAPQLWNVVEEMTIAAGLPNMPRVFIMDDPVPNAFAVGRDPSRAAVAVTTAMLKRMNRDELQGVIGHEIGHIHNYDVRFMTLASVMVGSIVLISEVFLRSLWFGGGRRRSSSSKGGGQAQAILLVVAIVLAILAPIAVRLLFLACSRRREYLADACSARFTRYPDGLASALEKIGASASAGKKERVSKGLAPLYIVNPLQSASAAGLFSTHPPLEKRIGILRSMAGGAGYVDYESAFRKVWGEKNACLDPAFLSQQTHLEARKSTPQGEKKKDAAQRAREAIGVLDRAAGFLMIPCVCGMRIKIPPQLALAGVKCPRCGRFHDIPKAEPDADDVRREEDRPLVYHRKGEDWESFRCPCGGTIQLSPTFSAEYVSCKKCGRHVKVAK